MYLECLLVAVSVCARVMHPPAMPTFQTIDRILFTAPLHYSGIEH